MKFDIQVHTKITGNKQYGDNLTALAVTLNTVGMMGLNRYFTYLTVEELFNDINEAIEGR